MANQRPITSDDPLRIGVLGAITAEALLDDDDWVVVGALGGAAAGVLVARDRDADRCAYSTGDGTYIVRRC